jgi:hypothetical protein
MERINKIKLHLQTWTGEERRPSLLREDARSSQAEDVDMYDVDGGRNPATHFDGWGYSVSATLQCLNDAMS